MTTFRYLAVIAASSSAIVAASAAAQSASTVDEPERTSSSALLEEIFVSATKKSEAERLQDVPASITAYGALQLETMKVRNLESLTFSMPNVALDQLGTQKGIASFSIRGLGVNSSVPSVEPAVGTFVNGIYMGTNFGVVMDAFDIESVEVLRGPQGVLFGRNVTGGAIVMRTARPTGGFGAAMRVSYESGDNRTYAGSIENTLVEGRLYGKLAGYLNDDGGYFENIISGRKDGQNRNWFVRPTLVFEASDNVDFTLIAESGKLTGDGPVARNPAYVSEFKTAQSYPGVSKLDHHSVILETNIHVPFGDGTITNILGYRAVEQFTDFDVDGAPQNVYELRYYLDQDQLSNELRYAGSFGRVDIVSGLFWFTQDMTYLTGDDLSYLSLSGNYGGSQEQTSLGAFVNGDIQLGEKWVLGLGARYARDKKEAWVASRVFTDPQSCSFELKRCTDYYFNDKKTFDSFTPRVMLKYEFDADANVYASYTKGFRSGGYNLRSTTAAVPPGPFDDERSSSYEIGFKSTFLDGAVRFNASAFYNEVERLQRETSVTTPTGFVTVLGNAADARIQGVEAEFSVLPTSGLVLRGSIGITDGEYTEVYGDLNSDGIVDERDLALKLPRLAELTYSIGAYYDTLINGLGDLGLALTFDHRGDSYFNDANTGPLPAFDNLFASVSLAPSFAPNTTISVYGKNLLEDWNTGNNTPLGTLPSGGAIQFSTKGRLYGAEFTVQF